MDLLLKLVIKMLFLVGLLNFLFLAVGTAAVIGDHLETTRLAASFVPEPKPMKEVIDPPSFFEHVALAEKGMASIYLPENRADNLERAWLDWFPIKDEPSRCYKNDLICRVSMLFFGSVPEALIPYNIQDAPAEPIDLDYVGFVLHHQESIFRPAAYNELTHLYVPVREEEPETFRLSKLQAKCNELWFKHKNSEPKKAERLQKSFNMWFPAFANEHMPIPFHIRRLVKSLLPAFIDEKESLPLFVKRLPDGNYAHIRLASPFLVIHVVQDGGAPQLLPIGLHMTIAHAKAHIANLTDCTLNDANDKMILKSNGKTLVNAYTLFELGIHNNTIFDCTVQGLSALNGDHDGIDNRAAVNEDHDGMDNRVFRFVPDAFHRFGATVSAYFSDIFARRDRDDCIIITTFNKNNNIRNQQQGIFGLGPLHQRGSHCMDGGERET